MSFHNLVRIAVAHFWFMFVLGFGSSSPAGQRGYYGPVVAEDGKLCSLFRERFHNETQKCYLLSPRGEQGPCGGNMTLGVVDGSQFVTCKCKDDRRCSVRRLTYYKEQEQCYNSFEQGPCKPDEWLVPDVPKGDRGSKCEPNPCLSWVSSEEPAEKFKFKGIYTFAQNGTCYQTYTRGYCEPNQVVTFRPDIGSYCFYPNAWTSCGGGYGPTQTAYIACSDGQERDKFGGCAPRSQQYDYV